MILVTGAIGFIGSNFIRHLLDAGHEVVGTDRRAFAEGSEPQAPGFRFIQANMEDAEVVRALLSETKPRRVVALAEDHGRMQSIVERSATTLGSFIDAADEAGVERICFASSIAVFMGQEGPFREDALLPIDSVLHVGAMKKAAEQVAAWHNKHGTVQTVSLRLANIYGPRYHSMMNSPSRMLFEALGRPISVDAPPLPPAFYRMAADYCHVDDCCKAIRLIVEADNLAHRVYNIGGGSGTTEEHVRHAVELALGRNAEVHVRDSSSNYLDITRIGDELGYSPKHDLYSGIAAYREWLLTNER